ncbi:anti-anti sigma factor HsbA [Silvimonas sp. JCM 19000]
MAISWRQQGGVAIIAIGGQLSFEMHREFKEVASAAIQSPLVDELHLDFSGVTYLDSAALGMLLLLRQRVEGYRIVLLNCGPGVRSVLDIANFNKIFEMRD